MKKKPVRWTATRWSRVAGKRFEIDHYENAPVLYETKRDAQWDAQREACGDRVVKVRVTVEEVEGT